MRIGVDARPLSVEKMGGISTYVCSIIERVDMFDSENDYFLYSNRPLLHGKPVFENVHSRIIPAKNGTAWLLGKMPSVLREDGIDVFWGTQHVLPRRIEHARYVLTIHDLALLRNPKWGKPLNAMLQRVLVPLSVKRADAVIADSDATRNDVSELCGCPLSKITRIYLGGGRDGAVPPVCDSCAMPVPLREKWAIAGDFFLFLGTFDERKNISTLLKAYELYLKTGGGCELVLAGGMGWDADALLAEVPDGARSRIKFAGYVTDEEKQALLAAAQALVFPSNYEGFGIPILEAFNAGCVVITANNSSLPEVAGDAALYVENAQDAIGLSAALHEVDGMPGDVRKALIERGRQRASLFTWDSCAKETIALLTRNG